MARFGCSRGSSSAGERRTVDQSSNANQEQISGLQSIKRARKIGRSSYASCGPAVCKCVCVCLGVFHPHTHIHTQHNHLQQRHSLTGATESTLLSTDAAQPHAGGVLRASRTLDARPHLTTARNSVSSSSASADIHPAGEVSSSAMGREKYRWRTS